ncbi:benzoate membrane transport protein [Vibrio xiamenensis]|uniref:Benzoate membrane transport protein n=1 Tax=Vibrio xiamenensis TaxID=861298 RepID=A0A1G7XX72_9VIBR|nr:benzoate/H(+) symporter BenE family transporter [Vibrio xiamenensis]SDG77403.1 benzoate membrane transport protein [Vibrio xiamenensis]SDG88802.1 benzoate membrane transport protein [Vibrio xiamenensis]
MLARWFNPGHISAGFGAVLVGYTSSVVIIIQAAKAAGASAAQIESWLLALGLVMGLTSILFSWHYKKPVLTAWSTPGAAMLVTAVAQYSLSEAIGAFMITGVLIVITGLITPLSRAIERIPPQLGTAMLGAILLPFCLKAFTPLSSMPMVFLLMFASYLLAKHLMPRYTMLTLLIVGVACGLFGEQSQGLNESLSVSLASPVWIKPEFTLPAAVNLALPLYVVTMLSQNLPGIAMMRSYHYDVPVKPLLVGTGLANLLFAPIGGFSVNLAAISAAICMNEQVDSDKSQRYRAVIWAGMFYLMAGLFATSVVALFLALPNEISHILAGFALLGTLLMCLSSAFKQDNYREPALFTFLITLSGVSFLGMSSTLWGLLVGLVYLRLSHQSGKA